jgi:hypothetical protein
MHYYNAKSKVIMKGRRSRGVRRSRSRRSRRSRRGGGRLVVVRHNAPVLSHPLLNFL